MTILDCSISLKIIKQFGCVGSCGYAPASVKLTFTTDLEGEFVGFTIDSFKWYIKSLIGFNSTHFGPTIFAIKSKYIHWFGVVVFDLNNSFERDDFSSIFYNDF